MAQHSRDQKLFESFIKYFDCGKVQMGSNKTSVYFVVTKLIDLENKILPFFHKYNLLASKNKEFIDLCEALPLVKSKSHLTEPGLNKLLEIKSGMNKGRKLIELNQNDNDQSKNPYITSGYNKKNHIKGISIQKIKRIPYTYKSFIKNWATQYRYNICNNSFFIRKFLCKF